MFSRFPTSVVLLCACLLGQAALAQNQNLFVSPPATGSVAIYTADPFSPSATTVSAVQDTFLVLAKPDGSKFYFIGRTGNIAITGPSFNVLSTRSLGSGVQSAAMTPNGQYLVVAAGSVHFIETTNDTVVATAETGASPSDVAVGRESRRVYATIPSQGRLAVIDTQSGFQTIANVQGLGPIGGVAVGPNGFVYVSATNVLYEIDPRDNSFRLGAGIPINAVPGKPVIIGDTFGSLRAVVTNSNAVLSGQASVLSIDLGTRLVTPLFSTGVVLDRLIPVAPNRVIATSTSGTLYDIALGSGISQASFVNLGSTVGARYAVASNEFPLARYLYLGFSNSIARIDLLGGNILSGQFSTTSAAGPLSYAGPAATGTPSSLVLFNNGQSVTPGAVSLPLIVRALDGSGRPVANVPVTFTPVTVGASLVTVGTVVTDFEGYAQAQVLAPLTAGPFQVTVNAGSGITLSGTFNLTAGTGTAGPSGAVSIKSGNGQVIRETTSTPEPLRVVVRDTAGNLVPNAQVTWDVTTITPGAAAAVLSSTTTFTDIFGESTNFVIGPTLGPALLTSFVQYSATASTFTGSVTFYVTVIPNLFAGTLASGPVAQILAPLNSSIITGQAGTTLPGAIQVRVIAGSGPNTGAPIPNVGVRVTTGNDPAAAPTAVCGTDVALTDTNGVATCDLTIGGKVGTTGLSIVAGGSAVSTDLTLVVTPGQPGVFHVVQGDNQQGAPGQLLPLALVATVADNFGNLLNGAAIQWAVDSGSATLENTISRSDNNARISTLVRLGNTPGPVKIRVSAPGGPASASATFNLTIVSTGTQITPVSGSGQSAVVNQAFGQQLVVLVVNSSSQPVAGIPVNFAVTTGSASVSPGSAITDASGNARTSVTAGGTSGAVIVSASFSGPSGAVTAQFNLTVLPIGPTLDASGILNAASGQPNITPGSIVTITGTNIATGVQGYVVPASVVGPLPTTLANVRVTFAGNPAPIFWVGNVNGVESVTVQVPFETPGNGTVPVTVFSGNTSATANVAMQQFSPGIFETVDLSSRRYAIAVKENGSFVSPDNPANRGERIRLFVTGLGTVNPLAGTNAPGVPGQAVTSPVVVGVNDAGVTVISAEYAQNLIGMYIVTFLIPTDTATGSQRNLAVAIVSGGQLIFGNGSNIAIQ